MKITRDCLSDSKETKAVIECINEIFGNHLQIIPSIEECEFNDNIREARGYLKRNNRVIAEIWLHPSLEFLPYYKELINIIRQFTYREKEEVMRKALGFYE